MSASTKLSTAVQALCHLAETHPAPQSSAAISLATGLNASKLRRILSLLAQSGIVRSEMGHNGGFTLIKPPRTLHLQEIYCSIEDRKAFHLDVSSGQSSREACPPRVDTINCYMLSLYGDIQITIEESMQRITLESILASLS